MSTVVSTLHPVRPSLLKDVVLPKEHGSWSLAFEPIALGLLAAPSVGGGLLALALSALFFARRPLRIHGQENRVERKTAAFQALAICGMIAAVSLSATVLLNGVEWVMWLAPVGVAGAIFAHFDRRGAGREEAAEVAGSAAFAMVPAAIGILGGLEPWSAVSLTVLALGRSVPSVLCVRSFLRARKTGVRRATLALVTACAAVASAGVLYHLGHLPLFAVVWMVVLAARAFALLAVFQPDWRARTIGMLEAMIGVALVVSTALAWRA
jgi:hypothetical protein